jgi:hypothetical protein
MRKDLTGNKFGRLLVEDFSGTNKWQQAIWKCVCDCGKIKTISTNHLTSGLVQSCGCLQKEIVRRNNWKGFGEIGKDYWTSIQKSASYRKIEFDLNIEYAWKIYLDQERVCALSGLPISFDSNRKSCRQTASLDRINSDIGYVESNVQWLHKKINMCKCTMTSSEFVEICIMIADFSCSKVSNKGM